ncbi:DUF362 domain-containing protein [candidate division KSB1 bacterium]|nr:DUF362 domain-containing protein [candidate division KSB1 bacterium]
MMTADVYFIRAKSEENLNVIQSKIDLLFRSAGFDSCIEHNDMTAIKIHFGEKGNVTHIPPTYVLPVARLIEANGGKPFVTDTNVLYKSQRSDAVSHLKLAQGHGFTVNNCGAPVIIADGLRGSNEIDVTINGELFEKVSIATEAITANSLIVFTHPTGHLSTGFGGTLKNLGMGLSSRKGKLRQHSAVKPWVEKTRCTQCGQCIIWCPVDAIEWRDEAAFIVNETCIGCGECLTVCRFDAVKFNWRTSGIDLQKRIAEHALGVVKTKKDKAGYFSFLLNVTRDCDCVSGKQQPLFADIGIIASKDPVALDQATLDMIEQETGKPLRLYSYPDIDDTVQLVHGEKIGLGTRRYRLKEISL